MRLPSSYSPILVRRWERLKRYPEIGLLCFSLTALLLGCCLHLPLSPPDLSAAWAILQYYLVTLALTIVLHLMILVRSRSSRESSIIILGLSIPTLLVVSFCHFQCKVWMPLINPHRFGPFYESVDRLLAPFVTLCTGFVALMERAGIDVSTAYHGWFVLLFFFCFGLHALYDTPTGQRQVILGVGWILALGGVSYWIAPAVGPFIYRHGADSHATLMQQFMWSKFHLFVLTRHIPPSYFLAPPAAMPSLHVAHAAFLIWMLRRISRALTLLLLPALVWFMLTAVGLAWHYTLDLVAGLLLTSLVVMLVRRVLPAPRNSAQSAAAGTPAAEELLPA